MKPIRTLQLVLLQRQYDAAPPDQKKEIKKQIEELQGQVRIEADEEIASTSEQSEEDRVFSPFLASPYAAYCGHMMVIFAIKVDDNQSYMLYSEYREAHPERSLIDEAPGVVYTKLLAPDRYEAYNLTDHSRDPLQGFAGVLEHCSIDVPEEPADTALVNLLLLWEAQCDQRMEDLYGPECLEDMQLAAKAGLFKDYWDGVICNVINAGMTLEEARAYAKKMQTETSAKKKTQKSTEQNSQPKQAPSRSSSQPTPKKKPTSGNRSLANSTGF